MVGASGSFRAAKGWVWGMFWGPGAQGRGEGQEGQEGQGGQGPGGQAWGQGGTSKRRRAEIEFCEQLYPTPRRLGRQDHPNLCLSGFRPKLKSTRPHGNFEWGC